MQLNLDVTADAQDAVTALGSVGDAAGGMATEVQRAGETAAVAGAGFDTVADGADNVASKSSQATGALGALAGGFEALGLPVLELPSGAGHDAGILATAGVPSGMLFVRSLNGGISHNPDELSSPEDIALAVDALTGALRRLVK